MEVIELDTGKEFRAFDIRLSYFRLVSNLTSFFSCFFADFGSSFSGALTDEQGRIRAIWGSFSTQVHLPTLQFT